VPDEVLRAMHRPAIDIYSGDLVKLTENCLADLKRIFRTDGHTYIYAANGHGAWEAALCNVLSRGDKILVAQSGLFAVGWGEMAQVLGVEVEVLPGDWRRAVDPAAVEARLKADTAGEIKAVLVVQIDTASSVVNDIPAIRKAIDAAGHDTLYLVDTIASLATMAFEMDAWGVDVAVAGSQKGLMTPPGLGFIAASDKARAAHARADLVTRYWDWSFRDGQEHYMKYCGTPPEHLMFGLRQALDMLLAEGLDKVIERHRLLSRAVHAAVDTWRQGGALDFNIETPEARSAAVTSVLCSGCPPKAILDFCRKTCGVTLGLGIGGMDDKLFRIAHMGHVNAPMVLGVLGSIEVALVALGIAHGEGGVQAAADSLGRALATKVEHPSLLPLTGEGGA
jgi:alanine-glyoxylate transaminase / serine-glyoxylate transaminase / serine-pyruvate transaminase